MSRSAVSLYLKFESGLIEGISPYLIGKKHQKSAEEWRTLMAKLALSTTVYVGNLSFYTTESQIYALFSSVGHVKRVIMGLNRITKEACGFCFVEYDDHKTAVDARMYLDGATLDNRIIRVDIDEGFEPGREFGKAKSGGQVRDDVRENFDVERGGWSHKMQQISQMFDADKEKTGAAGEGAAMSDDVDARRSGSRSPVRDRSASPQRRSDSPAGDADRDRDYRD